MGWLASNDRPTPIVLCTNEQVYGGGYSGGGAYTAGPALAGPINMGSTILV